MLGYYKLCERVVDPKFQTQDAACFDLAACFHVLSPVVGYDQENCKTTLDIVNDVNGIKCVVIPSHMRVLVPTGIIFDIPVGHSLRIHPRSSVAYKRGLWLANCEAIIDSDYVHETFLLIFNSTDIDVKVTEGERLAQAELVSVGAIGKISRFSNYVRHDLLEIEFPPKQKTDRVGGLGSTGE